METHADLIIASSLSTAALPEFLAIPDTDVSHVVKDSFSVDDARDLVEESSKKGFSGRRDFVIFTEKILAPAQNALLKLFEEPPAQTYFHLIIPDESLLLPTLRSRLVKIEDTKINENDRAEAKDFFKKTFAERLIFITEKAEKDPLAIEHLAVKLGKLNIQDSKWKASLLLVLRYIKNNGASRKMLAEELALSLPKAE